MTNLKIKKKIKVQNWKVKHDILLQFIYLFKPSYTKTYKTIIIFIAQFEGWEFKQRSSWKIIWLCSIVPEDSAGKSEKDEDNLDIGHWTYVNSTPFISVSVTQSLNSSRNTNLNTYSILLGHTEQVYKVATGF